MSVDFSRVFGYTVSAVTSLVGICVITGLLAPENLPTSYRVMTGVVLLLWGIYRFGMIRMKIQEAERLERTEKEEE